MKTASLSNDFDEGRIGISRGVPRTVRRGYRLYRKLAPEPWFNSVPTDEYRRLFLDEVLAPLAPQQVWEDLHALCRPAVGP